MESKVSKKNKRDNMKKDTIISVTFLAVVVIGMLAAVFYGNGLLDELIYNGERKVDIATGKVVKTERQYDVSEISGNGDISVPGYEKFRLKAGSRKQKVYLTNPKENTCYFVMSLVLEDGTVIWKSDYLEPGTAFDRIMLDEPLKAGNYENVTLKYDCYSLIDKKELNGSAIKINLEVE